MTQTPEQRIEQLEQQQSLTIEVLRRVLQGKWDEGRIYLDSIDPAHSGTWSNVPFVPGP